MAEREFRIYTYERCGQTMQWDATKETRRRAEADDDWVPGQVRFEQHGGMAVITVCWLEPNNDGGEADAEELADTAFKANLPGHTIIYREGPA